jgi:hypothetical protein
MLYTGIPCYLRLRGKWVMVAYYRPGDTVTSFYLIVGKPGICHKKRQNLNVTTIFKSLVAQELIATVQLNL